MTSDGPLEAQVTPPPAAAHDGRTSVERAVAAVWRIDSANVVATLTRVTGDFGLAEDLAQEALLDALRQWPVQGVPRNPAAWLTAVAKRKAIDGWRRRVVHDDRMAAMAHDLAGEQDDGARSPRTPTRSTTTCSAWS